MLWGLLWPSGLARLMTSAQMACLQPELGWGTCSLVPKLRVEVLVDRLRRGCAFQGGEHGHEVLEEAVCQVAVPSQACHHLHRGRACGKRGWSWLQAARSLPWKHL